MRIWLQSLFCFFYLLFLLQWNYFTVKLLILQERRVVTNKQSWGTEDVIQLSDIRPEFTSISFTGWIGCSIMHAPQPCWGKGHLLLSFRSSHICLHLSYNEALLLWLENNLEIRVCMWHQIIDCLVCTEELVGICNLRKLREATPRARF